jgi:uncharacterized repeat protein (TIGR03803 family)
MYPAASCSPSLSTRLKSHRPSTDRRGADPTIRPQGGHSSWFSLSIAAALLVVSTPFAFAQTENVLYSFPGSPTGSGSAARLTLHDGKLYGTTSGGGNGYGTVFELSPGGSGTWNENTLYTFTGGADGNDPDYSYVIFDSAGNLYGTTVFGGKYEHGVVFELSPSANGWTESVLHSFSGRYSSYPANGLVMDSAGNLYGTTDNCCSGPGEDGAGVFELMKSSSWTEKTLFTYPSAGSAGLAIDSHGDLFGYAYIKSGTTTVFELSPDGKGGWTEKSLYMLTIAQGALSLNGSPALDKHGNLYGVTEYTGPEGYGTVFKLSPSSTEWTYQLLYNFNGTTDGSHPVGGPTLDSKGNIYGTTQLGGAYCEAEDGGGCGEVYKLTLQADGNYTEQVLWSFDVTNNGGGFPLAPVILNSSGDIFGTTPTAGANGQGNVYELTP